MIYVKWDLSLSLSYSPSLRTQMACRETRILKKRERFNQVDDDFILLSLWDWKRKDKKKERLGKDKYRREKKKKDSRRRQIDGRKLEEDRLEKDTVKTDEVEKRMIGRRRKEERLEEERGGTTLKNQIITFQNN